MGYSIYEHKNNAKTAAVEALYIYKYSRKSEFYKL